MNIKKIMKAHNVLVKPIYRCDNIGVFLNCINTESNCEEGNVSNYIEISSNETLSGHAEIIEL